MFGALFALIVLAVVAAPLYASQVAHTTPSENHLTDQTVVDGELTNVVSLEGVPIGPTWNECCVVLYVEVIFGLPAVGALTAETIGSFDLPPIVALAVYLAIVVVFFSALVDLIVAWLDPRVRHPGPST